MDAVDVSIVTFRPDLDLLERLCASIAEQADGLAIRVYVQDNSDGADHTPLIRALPSLAAVDAFAGVDVARSASNLGFGRGHNANAARGTRAWKAYLTRNSQTDDFLPGDAFRDFLESEWNWYERNLGRAGLLPGTGPGRT